MADFYGKAPGVLGGGGGSSGGVTELNGLTGDIDIVAGTGITVTPAGQDITIAAVNNGDVVGPASATDNAIARYDGTTGKLIQNSSATVDDTGILTTAQGNFGGATGNGATVGAVNLKGTDSLGSQLQLEGPNSANPNRFLYLTQRENGDFFMYNPGLNRVIFDYGYALNATSIGQSSGTYQFNVIAPDSGTSLGTIIQGTGLGLTNTDATAGNFSVLGFQGTSTGRSPDSAVYGVHDLHAGASSSGSLEFWTRSAGTFARRVRINVTGTLVFDAYGAGVLFTDASGNVTAVGTTGTGNVVLATAPTMSDPVVGTQSPNDNSTKAASTAYVDAAVPAYHGTDIQEVLAGTFGGANTTYTLSHTPKSAMGVIVGLGAALQCNGVDFSVSGTTVTFTGVDTSAINIIAIYRY